MIESCLIGFVRGEGVSTWMKCARAGCGRIKLAQKMGDRPYCCGSCRSGSGGHSADCQAHDAAVREAYERHHNKRS